MIRRLIVLLVLIPEIATAAPFLVCDPPAVGEIVESYLISVDGKPDVETPFPLMLDIAPMNLADGAHTITGRAKNVWGVSPASSPFSFKKGAPTGGPYGMRLSPK